MIKIVLALILKLQHVLSESSISFCSSSSTNPNKENYRISNLSLQSQGKSPRVTRIVNDVSNILGNNSSKKVLNIECEKSNSANSNSSTTPKPTTNSNSTNTLGRTTNLNSKSGRNKPCWCRSTYTAKIALKLFRLLYPTIGSRAKCDSVSKVPKEQLENIYIYVRGLHRNLNFTRTDMRKAIGTSIRSATCELLKLERHQQQQLNSSQDDENVDSNESDQARNASSDMETFSDGAADIADPDDDDDDDVDDCENDDDGDNEKEEDFVIDEDIDDEDDHF
ncbi:unnamed protein product [Rotaria magnacalcarata]|uniref:Uncharacterized protein n=3 Tax=Rotaria magnacalcarata TaxID=392030 RepID=A0A819S9T4_9BILA|nr:unnamed protein product [Rotaria magnacalcarata]